MFKYLAYACYALSAFFLVQNAHANLLFCPSTSQYIQIGDTRSDVAQKCGKPISKEEDEEITTEQIPTEQWFYEIGPSAQLSLQFIIQNRKVVEIRLQGDSVDSINLCRHKRDIRIGSIDSEVRSSCGQPIQRNQTTRTVETGKNKVSTWIYQFDQYQPALRLKFVNGKLSNITR